MSGADGGGAVDAGVGREIVSPEQLSAKVAEMGKVISADYEGRDPVLVGVLKGAFVFMSDLVRHLDIPLEVDFMAVSSYGAGTRSSGVVRIVKDLDADITGRHVLLIEDIVDSGLTLSFVRKNLAARHPQSLEVCALLVREGRQVEDDLELRYTGFRIPPDFVIGYGLDVDQRYRNLPGVHAYAGEPPG